MGCGWCPAAVRSWRDGSGGSGGLVGPVDGEGAVGAIVVDRGSPSVPSRILAAVRRGGGRSRSSVDPCELGGLPGASCPGFARPRVGLAIDLAGASRWRQVGAVRMRLRGGSLVGRRAVFRLPFVFGGRWGLRLAVVV